MLVNSFLIKSNVADLSVTGHSILKQIFYNQNFNFLNSNSMIQQFSLEQQSIFTISPKNSEFLCEKSSKICFNIKKNLFPYVIFLFNFLMLFSKKNSIFPPQLKKFHKFFSSINSFFRIFSQKNLINKK